MKNRLQVICSTDSNYLTYCGVMLTSLLENNKDVDIYITIDNHFPDNKQHELLRLEKKYACNIHFVKIDGTLLNLCRTDCNEYISKATYYKMFAAQLLPITEDKVIYLDCDMIIHGSLHELWNTDLSGYAMAGVPDIYNEADETYERLRYSKGKGYVNAGMLVINLKYWREHNVLQQCLDYIKQNKDNILWCEQDVLNALLHDYTLHLPLKFNYQIPMLMKCHYESFSHEQQQRILAERRPMVLHYVSGIKPWMIEYYACPFFDEWQVYKRKSLWRMRFPILPQHNQLRALIKRYILWPLGWKQNMLKIYVNSLS